MNCMFAFNICSPHCEKKAYYTPLHLTKFWHALANKNWMEATQAISEEKLKKPPLGSVITLFPVYINPEWPR